MSQQSGRWFRGCGDRPKDDVTRAQDADLIQLGDAAAFGGQSIADRLHEGYGILPLDEIVRDEVTGRKELLVGHQSTSC